MSNENVRKSNRIKARKKTSYLEDDFEYDYDIEQEISSLLDSNHYNHNEKMSKSKKSSQQNNRKTRFKKDRENKQEHVKDEVVNGLDESNSENIKDGAAKNNIYLTHFAPKSKQENKLSAAQKPEEESQKHKLEYQEEGKNAGGCFICDACNRICADGASYERHMKSHSGNRQFKCNLCEKSFVESCSLKRHMKTHDDDRPYPCDLCFKSFRDGASLIRHQRTHGERPKMFECPRCDKSFTDKHGLKRHERIHTGLRPYECKVCLKTFSESGSFKRHQKIHSGVRNFVCLKCNKCFLEKQSLVRHQKNVCGFGDGLIASGGSGQHGSFDFDHSQDSLYSGAEHSEGSIDDRGTSLTVSKCVQDALPVNKKHRSLTPPTVQENDKASAMKEKQAFSKDPPSLHSLLQKDPPSLHSLIQRDPNLYNSISSIVESIDSYEKMLDLCSDKGQSEIDAALKHCKPSEMPENLMCFECGEPLVDGENFKSGGRCFVAAPQNSFKCTSCEEDDNYGDPPVLTAEVELDQSLPLNDESVNADCDEEVSYGPQENRTDDVAVTSNATRNVFGGDETVEHLRERLQSQHGVYFIGEGHHSPSTETESNVGSETAISNTEASCLDINESDHGNEVSPHCGRATRRKSKDIKLKDNSTFNSESESADLVLPPPDLIKAAEDDIAEQQTGLSQLDYEADDPSIPSVFPCHLCTKVFASAPFLSQHLELHKRHPHKCMVCGRIFKNSPSLKRHMRTHTGEKPYSCPLCEKSFRDPSNFSKHKKACHPFDTMPSSADSASSTSSSSQYSTDDPSDHASTGAYLADLKRKLNFQPTLAPAGPKSPSSPSDHLFECGYDNGGEDDDNEDDDLPLIFGDSSQEEPSVKLEFKNDDVSKNGLTLGEGGVKNETGASFPTLCNICSKACKSEQHLEMHMNYHTGNPNLTCIECGKSFSDSFSLKRHARIHADTRPYMCAYCNRGYCDNWSLKKHQSRGCTIGELKVPADFLHPCPQCIRVFAEADFLQVHMKTHKGLLKFECDICLKRFSEAFNLKQHRRLHMAVCPGCEREFKDTKALTEHRLQDCPANLQGEAADPEEGFACPECGRVYSTKAYLERHKKFHSDLKPHVCEVCQKRFSEAFRLKRHLKVHTYQKPYTCEGCKKGFMDVSGLRRHVSKTACKAHKHQLKNFMRPEVNDYPCVICDKVFLKNYLLVRHMNVHSQDRPFACDVCQRSYKDTSSLKRHQLVHQGIKNFICSVCSKDFYYADSLKRHMSGSCGKKGKSHIRGKAKGRKAKSNNNINIKNKNTLNIKNDGGPAIKELNEEESLTVSDGQPCPSESLTVSNGQPCPTTNVGKLGPIGSISRNVKLSILSSEQNPRHWLRSKKIISNLKFLKVKGSSAHKNEKRFKCSRCPAGFSRRIYLTAHGKVHRALTGSKQKAGQIL